jgi:hypothetical protein
MVGERQQNLLVGEGKLARILIGEAQNSGAVWVRLQQLLRSRLGQEAVYDT